MKTCLAAKRIQKTTIENMTQKQEERENRLRDVFIFSFLNLMKTQGEYGENRK
jgi:hypothetical protein